MDFRGAIVLWQTVNKLDIHGVDEVLAGVPRGSVGRYLARSDVGVEHGLRSLGARRKAGPRHLAADIGRERVRAAREQRLQGGRIRKRD